MHCIQSSLLMPFTTRFELMERSLARQLNLPRYRQKRNERRARIYIGENESSTFWLSVMTDLQNRGVDDILIACVDGLKGFPEAIGTLFPKTEVQTCSTSFRKTQDPGLDSRSSIKYISAPQRLTMQIFVLHHSQLRV